MQGTLREQVQSLAAGLVGRADAAENATLIELEGRIPARGFAGFAQRLRSFSGGGAWCDIRSQQIHAQVPQAALRILSAHPDGRVRQACVQQLDGEPASLRWLLLRANDWYRPLAALATTRLLGHLNANTARWWLPYLTLVQGYGRGDASGTQAAGPVLAHIATVARDHPEAFESFLAGSNHPPETLRQAAALLGTYHPEAALRAAASSSDVLLRVQVLRSSPDPQQWLAAFRDPVPSLRVEALHKLWEAGLGGPELLQDGLFDAAASVREAAKFLARKAGQLETAAELYRAGPPGLAKFDGSIGVIPPAELEEWLRAYLDHPVKKLRKAAQLAFDRLRPEEAEALWWGIARTHPDPLERRTARRLLRSRRSRFLTEDQLWVAIAEANPTVVAELQELAAASPCRFTRLRAHLHSLERWPERWTATSFEKRLRQLTQALPPYRLEPGKRAILADLIARLPQQHQPALAGWLDGR